MENIGYLVHSGSRTLSATAIGLGALLAGILVAASSQTDLNRTRAIWGVGLFVAAAIYVGFVLAGSASREWLLTELGGVLLFSILAIVGTRYSPWFLAAGWLAHTAWDFALHGPDADFVPSWYPAACIGFDLVIGIVLLAMCVRSAIKAHS